jgi:hypothetical protein
MQKQSKIIEQQFLILNTQLPFVVKSKYIERILQNQVKFELNNSKKTITI